MYELRNQAKFQEMSRRISWPLVIQNMFILHARVLYLLLGTKRPGAFALPFKCSCGIFRVRYPALNSSSVRSVNWLTPVEINVLKLYKNLNPKHKIEKIFREKLTQPPISIKKILVGVDGPWKFSQIETFTGKKCFESLAKELIKTHRKVENLNVKVRNYAKTKVNPER